MNDDYQRFQPGQYVSPAEYGGRQYPQAVLPPTPANRGSRLGLLLVVLGLLLILALGPFAVQRFQYASTYGKEQAKVDVAIEGLSQLDKFSLAGLAEASRLVAQRVGPSVVHIRTVRAGGGIVGDETSHLFDAEPRQRQPALGEGSGVIVDPAGFIVTNFHVIGGATQITVVHSDGREFSAEVIGADKPTDIAVLRIDADNLIAAPWGDSDLLEVGDLIWAVGSPFGLDRSVTFGIVSAKDGGVTNSRYQEFLQTDAAVNPGNSGGPLVNIRGEVVGINTAIVGPSYQGISFSIPSAIVQTIFDKLRSGGRVTRGWLGVALRPVTADQAKQIGLKEPRGVLVDKVVPDSPAAHAGLEAGDVVLSWNGKEVLNATSLSWMVANTAVGSKAKVLINRGGSELTLEVDVAELPAQLLQ